jgi:GAF domain-containing protein
MKTPSIITRETPTPWEVRRNLTLSNGDTIEDVRIVATTVDHFGQECEVTEWFADLNRFNGLTEDLVDEAVDAASDVMSAITYRLSNGGSVFSDEAEDGDHEARWEAEQAAVENALSDLARLDRNGAENARDEFAGLTAAEQVDMIREAIRSIKANA